ncbi:MAG: thiosulfate oxidation carrier protein SoxY [Zoogloeaceae bacterium]|jgi:sulfur-oxidizing protein SoxY|nr:thiosulfate oxidation carrier protein SoxY [Zoogloeaceae bacterium]
MDAQRRILMKGMGAGSVLTALAAAGLLKPSRVFAAEEWRSAAFAAKDIDGALKGLGANNPAESRDIVLTVPEIAENGAMVPVSVVSNIPDTVSIAVLSQKNPMPLSAIFEFANGALPEAQIRMRLAETTLVKAVVKTADGKFYTARKEVKVTVGGCGA